MKPPRSPSCIFQVRFPTYFCFIGLSLSEPALFILLLHVYLPVINGQISNSKYLLKAIKKAEHRRIDAFELWCWKRLLRAPWTARRSNQSILKEISPGCSLEGPMLKLKLHCFGHLMLRADSFEKTLMLAKIEGRRRGQQRMR